MRSDSSIPANLSPIPLSSALTARWRRLRQAPTTRTPCTHITARPSTVCWRSKSVPAWRKLPLAIPEPIVYNTNYTMKYPPQAFVLRLRSRAMDACEPCQAGNRAALSGTTCAARVPVRSGCLRRVFHGASFCLRSSETGGGGDPQSRTGGGPYVPGPVPQVAPQDL